MDNSSPPWSCATGNTFPTNPDITGIGVRISLYASTIIGFIMAFFFPHDLDSYRDAARTSLVTSTSMIIASLYARYTGLGMSLIDAQIVTMFVTAITACYYSVSKFDFGFTTRIAVRMHLILSAVFGILVYYDVGHFGGTSYQPDCYDNTQFRFVIFSRTISATNQGLRIFALLLYAFVLGEFIWDGRKRFTIGMLRSIIFFTEESFGRALLQIAQHIAAGKLGGEKKGLPRRASFGGIVIIIYLIVTVEQMISWNGLNANGSPISSWTFGQTVAVVMLADQVCKLVIKFARRLKGQEYP
ncbi:hypothetical protein CALCODRAFT_93037 [Calocera cornea HHB12733]|uniref:Uncharacterized protein n=1 Tax=Calocera cornea HHB12733 TaxID=1353952 RepID=A0A165D994_9BASI|nr:hypothetical protein CALCODRAFT_93037 [Calocera cornea HHB12733]